MARTFYSVIKLVHIVTLACMIRNNQCQTNDDGDSIEVQFEVVEESRVNTEVGNVLEASGIRDLYPEEDFNTVQFEFVESPRFPFELDRFTGVVRVSGRLDREAWCANRAQCLDEVNVYVFIPDPAPQSVPRVLNLIKLKLHVYDINDNSPQFLTETRGVVRVQILENASPGFSVDLPTAIDADSTMFGVQGYNISVPGGGHQDIFTLRQTGGRVRLVLARELDREQQELYVLNYIAYDGGTPTPMIGTVLLEIEVADANDNSPRFAQPSYTVVVPESTEPHTSLLSVSAVDNDAGDNGQVYYTLSAYTRSLHGNTFVLDRESGQLSLGERPLNYEDTTHYRLDVVASDGGVSSVPAETTIDIEVTDVNDSPPSIRIRSLSIAGSNSAIAMENREAGAFVANVMINDADEGLGGEVECSLNQPEFELSNGNSRIQTTSVLDRENIGGFQLTLTCHDLGDPQLTSEESVYVQVGDENDNAPIFEHQSYEGEIIENNYIGTYVLKVNATDLDIGSNAFVTYELGNTRDAEMFNVDEITGVISARAVFDREDVSSVHFLVYAIDAGHPAQTSTAEVSVQVIDVNDETPMFLDESYSFGVKENETPGYELGVVSAIDRDGPTYSTITYSIMPSDSAVMERFSINPTNGHINTTVRLDREQRSVYHLVVRATDSGNPPLSGSSRVTIYLADLNDNRPLFDFPRVDNNTVLTSPGLPVGSTVTTVHATDLDSGANANVTYAIIDGNINSRFMLHPITGQLVVNKSLTDYQDATFSLEISARDNKHDTVTFLYITVNQTAPAVYGHSKILSGHNFIVVVILAAVSGAVMLLLIAAIVTIHRGRRVRNNKREGQYNCRRAESTRRSYESAPVKNSSWHGFKNAKKKTAQLSATVKDERSFSSEVEAGPGVRGNDSTKSWTTLHHQHPSGDNSGQWQPQACSSMMTNKSPYNSALTLAVQPLPRDAADLNRYDAPPKNREWNTNAHDHTEMTMMPTSAADCVEHDRDSLYSGSDSNTDSGRGCSEEGEASVGALSQSKSMQSFASSRAAQVVPVGSQSQCYSPNGNTSLESPYSSHDWTPSVTPQHHGYSPNLNTAFTGSYDSQHPPPRGKQRYKSAEDTGTIPGYHRYGLPLDTVSEDGGSTTSGSYVVDDDEDRRCTRKPSKRQSADAEEICRNIEMLCNYKPYGRLNSDSVV